MLKIFSASFGVIARRIPQRSFLADVSLTEVLGVYTVALILQLSESFIPATAGSSEAAVFATILDLAISIGTLLLVVFVSTWTINRYAADRFTHKEMFALYVLVTGATSIVYSILWLPVFFLGESWVSIASIFGFVFGVYMLFTYQKAVSEIAGVTKSQAAKVILAPLGVFLGAWLLFLLVMFAAGFASSL